MTHTEQAKLAILALRLNQLADKLCYPSPPEEGRMVSTHERGVEPPEAPELRLRGLSKNSSRIS